MSTSKMSHRPACPSMSEALANAHLAHRLFGTLDGVITLDASTEKERKEANAAISTIVEKFKLTAKEQELRTALVASAEAYWTWWALRHDQTAGLGEKTTIEALERALRRASQLLQDKKVRNRLEKLVKTTDPANLPVSPKSEVYYKFDTSIFDSVSRSHATINGLLKVSALASTLDGRDDAASQRDDLRAAAEPLRQFWMVVAGQSGKLGQRGGIYSPAVRFLHACLKLIDPTATERLIVDFGD